MRPTLINKGEIVKRALSQREAPNVDFILCCGDDKTDEDMFRILERADLIGNEAIQFKVYVGTPSTVTLANWRVDSSEAMINILQDLSK